MADAESESIRRAVEAAYPSLRCTYVQTWRDAHVRVHVVGSAVDLTRHGFLTAQMVQMLPPCGVKTFGHWQDMPFTVRVTRRKDGSYQCERSWSLDSGADDAARWLNATRPAAYAPPSEPRPERPRRLPVRRPQLHLVWVNPAM